MKRNIAATIISIGFAGLVVLFVAPQDARADHLDDLCGVAILPPAPTPGHPDTVESPEVCSCIDSLCHVTITLAATDLITFRVSGNFSSSGFTLLGPPSVTRVGDHFVVDLFFDPPDAIVLPVITPFEADADLGRLLPGSYTDQIRLFSIDDPQTPIATLDHSFVVIPEPATGAVLGLWGLVLASLNRRSAESGRLVGRDQRSASHRRMIVGPAWCVTLR